MFYNLIWWLFAIHLLCTIAEISTTATVTASNSRHCFSLCTLQPDTTSHDQTTQPISTLSLSRIQSIILLFSRNITYLNCKVVVWAPHPPSISFFFFFLRDIWRFWKGKNGCGSRTKSQWGNVLSLKSNKTALFWCTHSE